VSFVDPIDFDEKCDGSLPLEEMLEPDPQTRQLLEDIDRSRCRVWALTNAYRTVRPSLITHSGCSRSNRKYSAQHAQRVLEILNLRDQIEGVVFCDYQEEDFLCKPEPAFYSRVCSFVLSMSFTSLTNLTSQAMQQAGVNDFRKCLFVDDSHGNVVGAKRFGWTRSVHFREDGHGTDEAFTADHMVGKQEPPDEDEIPVINDLQQLREVWPDIFVQAADEALPNEGARH
jgi:pyrimidine and pyridine-specific 5'-nucleotidase